MSYEQALETARKQQVQAPAASEIVHAALEARHQHADDTQARRVQARRWMYVAAGMFLLMPMDQVWWAKLHGYRPQVGAVAAASVLPAALLAWAARLFLRPDFGSQMLARGIAASNLVVACLLALSVGGMVGGVAQILIALSCGAALLRVWDRGLGDDSPSGSFAPVRFRGFLVLALVLAFADAQTLAFSAFAQGFDAFRGSYGAWDDLRFTVGGALLMGLNVWGLYRLRTWAMLLNIVANLAIAQLALSGTLGVNLYVAAALSLTAIVQLLMPVPILATALGDRRAGEGGWMLGARVLPWVVRGLVALTVLAALSHTRFWMQRGWGAERGTHRRGLEPQPVRGTPGLLGEGAPRSGRDHLEDL